MNTCLKSLVLIAAACTLLSGTSLAEPLEKPESITKALQDKNLTTGKRPGGAHGSKSPHAKLSAQQHVQIALQHKAEGRIGGTVCGKRQPVSGKTEYQRGTE